MKVFWFLLTKEIFLQYSVILVLVTITIKTKPPNIEMTAITLLSIILVGVSHVVATQQCKNVFPAARPFAFGLDLSTFSMHKIDTGALSTPVFQFTCDKGQTQSIDQVYDIPDSVNSPIQEISGGDIKGVNILAADFAAKKLAMEADYSVDAFLGLFSASASLDFTYAQYFASAAEMGLVVASIAGFIPSMHPPRSTSKPIFSDDAADDLGALCQYTEFNDSAVDDYESWFTTYGTHYMTQACMGASMFSAYYTQYNFAAVSTDTFISAEGSIGSLIFAKAAGGFSGDVGTLDAAFAKASVFDQYWIGGSGQPGNTSDTFNKWALSGLIHPHIITCPTATTSEISEFNGGPVGLAPLSTLMTNLSNPSVPKIFNLASQNYYDKIFLRKELLSHVDDVINRAANFTVKGDPKCPNPYGSDGCTDPVPWISVRCVCIGCDTLPGIYTNFTTIQQTILAGFKQVKETSVKVLLNKIVDHNQVLATATQYYLLLNKVDGVNKKSSCHWQRFWNDDLRDDVEVASLVYPAKMV